jgi:acyl phosphate:glycerol-3-phosphate acyltransferase
MHTTLGILAAVAYFIGAIPFGLLIGLLKGKDIRLEGSKNIGATNAGRVLGKKFFWIVFFLDMFKSLLPMLAASYVVAQVAEADRSPLTYALWLGVGIAALLGHVFPVYLKFKGGKGVATSTGVILGLWPYFTLAGVVTVFTFIVVAFLWRYVSLASMAGAVMFPIAYAGIELSRGGSLAGSRWPLLALACLIPVLIVIRHKENIKRLLAGTENKIGAKRAPSPSSAP